MGERTTSLHEQTQEIRTTPQKVIRDLRENFQGVCRQMQQQRERN